MQKKKFDIFSLSSYFVLLAILVVFGIFGNNFLTLRSIYATINNGLPLILITCAVTFSLIVGIIDLSCAAIGYAAGVTSGMLMHWYVAPFPVALLVGLAMYYFFPKDIYNFRLNYVRWMLIYFTAGILACRYNVLERLNGWWCIIVSGALFAALYYIELVPHRSDLPLSFAGIAFTVAVCRKIAEHCPSLFSSFRDYTYQIFLMAIFLQMPIRWLFSALHQNWLYLPLYAASLLIGIYVPTMIAKALQKRAPRYVKVCFGLS